VPLRQQAFPPCPPGRDCLTGSDLLPKPIRIRTAKRRHRRHGARLANGIVGGINNHPLTLMSLGAGIAQGGIGRSLALATAAAQAERNLQAQQVNHAHVFNALTGAGVPPDEALAAVLNPSLMRALAVKYLGPHSGGRSATAAPGAVSTSAVAGSNTYNPPPASAGASATATTIPAYPASVPSGAYFSRSRNLWEDPDGNLFDLQGRPVK